MFVGEETRNRILIAIAVAAAGFIHVSIAASQLLLGLGVLLMLLWRREFPVPRIWIPLAGLLFWTILADVLSRDPWGGRAQIKKFFVFLFLPFLYGVFRRQVANAFYVVAAWVVAGSASGLLGLAQFFSKYEHAQKTGEDFYATYVGHRITGFESHWMTFSALQLSVLSLVLAQIFFSDRRLPLWVYSLSVTVLAVAILLGETRSIWIATVPATLYLVWCWRPKMIFAVPLLLGIGFALSPKTTQERLHSLVAPHGETDSNRHRLVTFRTGVEMIKAHPWFGIGPEQIRPQFDSYVPPDIRKPLPVGYYGHLHNDYVQYAAERGLPALVLLLTLIGMAVTDFSRAILRSGRDATFQRSLLLGAIAVIIGVTVGGLFEYNLGDSEVLMMFVSVIALGYAASTITPSKPLPAMSQNKELRLPDALSRL